MCVFFFFSLPGSVLLLPSFSLSVLIHCHFPWESSSLRRSESLSPYRFTICCVFRMALWAVHGVARAHVWPSVLARCPAISSAIANAPEQSPTGPEGHIHMVTTPEKPRKTPRTPAEPRRAPQNPQKDPLRGL